MKKIFITLFLTAGFTAMLFGDAAEEVRKQKAQLEEMGISPGDVAVELGAEQFDEMAGPNGKTCASCHGIGGKKIRNAFAGMPRFYRDAGRVHDLDMRIKYCLEKKMGVKKAERSDEFVNFAFFVASLANGIPVATAARHTEEKKLYEQGKKLWYARTGSLDLSCSTCHEKYGGQRIRLQTLVKLNDEKVGSRWPAYRFGKDRNWTLEDRIRACYKQTRVPRPAYYSDAVLSLTEYIMVQSAGAKVKIPGLVR